MIARAGPKIVKTRKSRVVVIAALVIGIVVAVSRWLPKAGEDSPDRVNALLREAYTEHRNLELRWDGAKFTPYRAESDKKTTFDSSVLLEAEEAAAKHRSVSDPAWAQVQGRLALLLGEPQAAIRELGRAREALPTTVPVLIDLASAYFEKAKRETSDISYGRSLELLGEALASDPTNVVALYNCAVVEESQFLYRQAEEHWRLYLKLDSTSDWSKEAARHLDDVQQKVDRHLMSIRAPLRNPMQVARGLREKDSAMLGEIESRIEEYSEVAVQDWLPQAYASPPEPDVVNALHALGEVLLQFHRDPWLRDFLVVTPNSATSQNAVHWLRRSILANIQGDTVDAQTFSLSAKRLFKAAGSRPGWLRAQVEEVNALRQLFKSKKCIAATQLIGKVLTDQGYYQLLARSQLERTSCLLRAGDEAAGIESLKSAADAVTRGRLHSQEINVLNYQSAVEGLKGRSGILWQMSRNALQLFWNGLYPDKRAYPFYIKLADWAEENGDQFLFLQFAREAAATIDVTDLTSFRAMAHYRLAEATVAALQYDIAQHEFADSERLFQELPQNGSVRVYRANIEVLLAGLEAQRGEYDLALTRLGKIERGIGAVESFLTKYQFYSIRASVFAMQGKNSDAERDYRRAIAAAEELLVSVKDERERLAWSRAYGAAYRGLSQVLIHEGQTTEALQVWESFRASDLRSFAKQLPAHVQVRGVIMKDLADAQHHLGSTMALVYMLTNEGLAIWTVSAQRIEFRLGKVDRSDLVRSVERLVSLCSDSMSDIAQIQAQARSLYQVLLEPVKSSLSSSIVIVEPDEELAGVPFEVLIGPDGHYFVENKSVSYLPSIFFVSRLRSGTMSNGKALVVGVSTVPEVYRGVLQPLLDAEQEAREIGRELPHAQVLTGDAAQKSNVLLWLGESNIFHFAGHSVYERGKLELLLSQGFDDGSPLLDVGGLSSTKLKSCHMIVLSACSTQGSSGESFHEAQNVVRLILQARVPHTVASRWDIDSRTTTEFMKEFYRQFSLEKDTGRSLALAMREFRKKSPHPYYWAAFSHFGRNSF